MFGSVVGPEGMPSDDALNATSSLCAEIRLCEASRKPGQAAGKGERVSQLLGGARRLGEPDALAAVRRREEQGRAVVGHAVYVDGQPRRVLGLAALVHQHEALPLAPCPRQRHAADGGLGGTPCVHDKLVGVQLGTRVGVAVLGHDLVQGEGRLAVLHALSGGRRQPRAAKPAADAVRALRRPRAVRNVDAHAPSWWLQPDVRQAWPRARAQDAGQRPQPRRAGSRASGGLHRGTQQQPELARPAPGPRELQDEEGAHPPRQVGRALLRPSRLHGREQPAQRLCKQACPRELHRRRFAANRQRMAGAEQPEQHAVVLQLHRQREGGRRGLRLLGAHGGLPQQACQPLAPAQLLPAALPKQGLGADGGSERAQQRLQQPDALRLPRGDAEASERRCDATHPAHGDDRATVGGRRGDRRRAGGADRRSDRARRPAVESRPRADAQGHLGWARLARLARPGAGLGVVVEGGAKSCARARGVRWVWPVGEESDMPRFNPGCPSTRTAPPPLPLARLLRRNAPARSEMQQLGPSASKKAICAACVLTWARPSCASSASALVTAPVVVAMGRPWKVCQSALIVIAACQAESGKRHTRAGGCNGAAWPGHARGRCCSRAGYRRTAPGQSAWVPLAIARACREQGDALCDWNPSRQEHALQEHGGGVTQPPSDCPPGHPRHGDGIRARLWHASQLCQGSQECVLRLASAARAGEARCRDLGEARQIRCHAGRAAANGGLGLGLGLEAEGLGLEAAAGFGRTASQCSASSSNLRR
eukprot:scaffold92283_cov75-Phaeocystis_antarctica.AAC.2